MNSGTELGAYTLLEPIGSGGMGEVFRARDNRLDRDVAIKILPEAFANDADRLARFEREAKLLAQLNHPGIATLHGLEEANGTRFLVMELVPGETLAERIARGPVPLEEAVALFAHMAEALEAAHDRGIAHRDLKPANVKVLDEDRVKLLDFGLAKGLAPDSETDGSASSQASQSPTLTRETELGVILGTASYMSPEQARGKAIDTRTDVWAFGCCLYEALTGKKAFEGETVTDTLAAIVKSEPDWSALSSEVPVNVRRVLRRCLEKKRSERLKDIFDARLDFREAETTPEEPARSDGAARFVPWALALLGFAVALAAVAIRPEPDSLPLQRVEMKVPRMSGASAPRLSPDGSRLVFAGVAEGEARVLWLQPLDGSPASPIRGTEGGRIPFWHPDGQRIGFFVNNELRTVELSGSPPRTVAEVLPPGGRGGTWNRDGVILFSHGVGGLFRVSEGGGPVTELTTLDRSRQEQSHRWPVFLPDGRRFLYSARSAIGEHSVLLGSLDASEPKRLLNAMTLPRYAAPGILIYQNDNRLLAQRFDVESGSLVGGPTTLSDRMQANVIGGYFSVSNNGILVYVEGSEVSLQFFDRTGRRLPRSFPISDPQFFTFEISPDERFAALQRYATGRNPGMDIWTLELETNVESRWTTAKGWDSNPVWSPDGRRIAYRSERTLSVRDFAGGEGTGDELSAESDVNVYPTDWSPDGRYLLYEKNDSFDRFGVWAVDLIDGGEPIALAASDLGEGGGRVAPDGHLLAYVSDDSGQSEVYVKAFLGDGPTRQVSREGGFAPRWHPERNELFYFNTRDEIVAVTITDLGSIDPGTVLFPAPSSSALTGQVAWQVLRDDRFVFAAPEAPSSEGAVHIINNWTALLPPEP